MFLPYGPESLLRSSCLMGSVRHVPPFLRFSPPIASRKAYHADTPLSNARHVMYRRRVVPGGDPQGKKSFACTRSSSFRSPGPLLRFNRPGRTPVPAQRSRRNDDVTPRHTHSRCSRVAGDPAAIMRGYCFSSFYVLGVGWGRRELRCRGECL